MTLRLRGLHSNTAGAVDSFDSYDYAATEAAAYDDVAYEEAAEELAIDDDSDTSSGGLHQIMRIQQISWMWRS